jgi:hypothetical protein
MIDATLVSLVSATTALIASIAGPLVTVYVTRTQFKTTVRAGNRQRWIDEFRDLIAHFCSEIAIAAQGREKIVRDGRIVIEAESEFLHAFRRLVYTANKIRLMVNPADLEHQELLELMERMLVNFRTAPPDHDLQSEGQAVVAEIVTRSRALIRHEWLLVQRGV